MREVSRSNAVGRVTGPCCALLIVFAPSQLSANDTSPLTAGQAQALADTCRLGSAQWDREAVFTSTYKSRFGQSTAHVEAGTSPLDRITASVDPLFWIAAGSIRKDRDKTRITVQFAADSQLLDWGAIDPSAPFAARLGESVDVLADGDKTFLFRPLLRDDNQVGLGNKLTVQRPDATGRTVFGLCGATEMLVTPLNAHGGATSFADWISGLQKSQSSAETASYEAERLDGGVVSLSVRLTERERQRMLVCRIWTDPYPPVVTDSVYTERVADQVTEVRTARRDFVECPGGLVPRQVVMTSDSRPSTEESSTVFFKEWISDDLGDRPPTRDDFVLTIPADAVIIGLNVLPPIVDGKRRVELGHVDDENLATFPQRVADVIDPSAPARAVENAAPVSRLWLITFNCAVVAMLAIYFFIRRRSRKDV